MLRGINLWSRFSPGHLPTDHYFCISTFKRIGVGGTNKAGLDASTTWLQYWILISFFHFLGTVVWSRFLELRTVLLVVLLAPSGVGNQLTAQLFKLAEPCMAICAEHTRVLGIRCTSALVRGNEGLQDSIQHLTLRHLTTEELDHTEEHLHGVAQTCRAAVVALPPASQGGDEIAAADSLWDEAHGSSTHQLRRRHTTVPSRASRQSSGVAGVSAASRRHKAGWRR